MPPRTVGTSTKPRESRRKEITQNREELNNIEIKTTILRVNKSSSWFFERKNKIDKLLIRLIKKKRERTQINIIRNERERLQQIPQKYKGL